MDLTHFDAFAARHCRNIWAWGSVDCTLVLADWIVWNGHVDPAKAQRGSYADEDECQALLARSGGLISLIERCACVVSMERISMPEFGSIAVIGSRVNVRRQWGAIYDGTDWRVRIRSGFPAFKANAIAVWRSPCLI